MEPSESSIRDRLVELFEDEELLFADGFDDCICGVVRGFVGSEGVVNRVLYDESAVLNKIASEMEGSEDERMTEAFEHFEFNIVGAYVGLGPRTPMFGTFFSPALEGTFKGA